jgi:hypothetical protein
MPRSRAIGSQSEPPAATRPDFTGKRDRAEQQSFSVRVVLPV